MKFSSSRESNIFWGQHSTLPTTRGTTKQFFRIFDRALGASQSPARSLLTKKHNFYSGAPGWALLLKSELLRKFDYEYEESSARLATSAQGLRLPTQSKSRIALTKVGSRLQILWNEGDREHLCNRDRYFRETVIQEKIQ